ncbi:MULTISPECIES: MrpH family fimbial adhesin [Providencia]|uniref:MrpH family fimbial adhesin n=1 Tax=Providencia TaxID=586 RepID=UPI0015EC86FA|nr:MULTISPECIES: adhesin [Providencia]ELR5136822.1 adhesin [Providencia rettgeri]ELR5167579.1 adhesin [Providencia rettgeri]QLQ93264.1 adhesin [Providencia rettgeri]WEB83886.1 adhesin [Providencia rettgeri]HCH7934986.1 adhesin [Providencia rettgeri]
MKVLLSLLIGAVMFLSTASASVFSYITESRPGNSPSYGDADYKYVIARWDPELPTTLNPCYGWPTCYLTISHKHTAAGTPGAATVELAEISKYRYMRDVQNIPGVWAKATAPAAQWAVHTGVRLQNNQECVGLFYQDQKGVTDKGGLIPGSLCGIAPPPIGACKINNTIPDINFGSISEADLAGQTKQVNIDVTCNLDMDVLVIATGINVTNGHVKLRPDGSLYADLYLGSNNTLGENGYKIHIPAGGVSTVNLKAVLGTNGRVEAGRFDGAAALILTVP